MSVWHRIRTTLPPTDLEERIRRELRHCAADRVIGPFPGILDSAPEPYGPDPIVFGAVPRVKNPFAD